MGRKSKRRTSSFGPIRETRRGFTLTVAGGLWTFSCRSMVRRGVGQRHHRNAGAGTCALNMFPYVRIDLKNKRHLPATRCGLMTTLQAKRTNGRTCSRLAYEDSVPGEGNRVLRKGSNRNPTSRRERPEFPSFPSASRLLTKQAFLRLGEVSQDPFEILAPCAP